MFGKEVSGIVICKERTNKHLFVRTFFLSVVRTSEQRNIRTYERRNVQMYKSKKNKGRGGHPDADLSKKKSVVKYRSLNSRIRQKGVFWRCRYLRVLVFDQYPYPNTRFKIGGYWYLAQIPIPVFWCKTHPTYRWLGFTKRALRASAIVGQNQHITLYLV